MTPWTSDWYFFIMMACICTSFSGLMSGLTVGLLSIDQLELEIKLKVGTPAEKKSAQSILPTLQCHHWLLVTLLLCNAVALEALPIFLDRLVPSHYAVLISVVAILIIGEVIPQAICIGPQQLRIAEIMAPLVRFLMYATCLISWPLSKALDLILGEHKITRFNTNQLGAIIEMHSKMEIDKHGDHIDFGDNQQLGLTQTQTKLISGALKWKQTSAGDSYKKLSKTYMLSADRVVDDSLIQEIKQNHFSRIPVYYGPKERNCVFGIILVKSLVGLKLPTDSEGNPKKVTVGDLITLKLCKIGSPLYVKPTTKTESILNLFKSGYSHLAIVAENPESLMEEAQSVLEVLNETSEEVKKEKMKRLEELVDSVHVMNHQVFGIITLENILESIFNISIIDEKDLEKIQRYNQQTSAMVNELNMSHFSQLDHSKPNLTNVSGFYDLSYVNAKNTLAEDLNIYTMAAGLGGGPKYFSRMKSMKKDPLASSNFEHFHHADTSNIREITPISKRDNESPAKISDAPNFGETRETKIHQLKQGLLQD
jgi:metal transporter CNNM